MKLYEIRSLTTEDLTSRLKEEKESLENLRFQKSIGQLENFKSINNTKKLIARIHTVLKERETTVLAESGQEKKDK
jgi:large subunit ribosomal protein L29